MTSALRRLARSPGYLCLSVVLLTAGVGSNALVYAAAEALLWNPFHVQESRTLYAIVRGTSSAPFRNDHLDAMRESLAGTLALTAFGARDAPVRAGTFPAEIIGSVQATREYFDVVRPTFALGRGFSATREAREVIISRALWARRLSSRTDVLGQSVSVHGHALTVVGVLDRFTGTIAGFQADVFVPVDLLPLLAGEDVGGALLQPGARFLQVLARNVSDLRSSDLEARLDEADRRSKTGLSIRTPASRERVSLLPATAAAIRGPARAHILQMTLLVGVVAILIFFTACANVVGLVIARVEGRRQELGVRVALGATRAQIVRTELLEVACISVIALGAGLAIAVLGQGLLDAWPVTLAGRVPLRLIVNARVALFSSVLAVGAVLVSGAWPLWRVSMRRPAGSLLPAASRTVAPRTTGRLLFVCAQVGGCTALAVTSIVALSQVRAELARPLGFDSHRLLAATVDVTQPTHAGAGAQVDDWLPRLRAAAADLPGVQSVAASDFAPLGGGSNERRMLLRGESLTVSAVGADANYFRTLRIPVVMGRSLQSDDAAEAVVNRALWARVRARGVSLGDTVALEDAGPRAGRLTIVGVVEDARNYAADVPAVPTVYLPVLPQAAASRRAVLLLRTTDRRDVRRDAVRRLVAERLPDVPLWRLDWIEDRYAVALRPARVVLMSLASGTALTLLLAMTGIQALLNYIIGCSQREIGIRTALGAAPGRAYMAVASGVIGAAYVGLILGAGAGWAGSHLLVGSPQNVDAFGVIAVLVGVALLLSVSVLAPAVRARRWDAAQLIRQV